MTLSNSQGASKDLSKSLPIPGYRGHSKINRLLFIYIIVPSYIYSAERSYGISSKECIRRMREAESKSA